MIFIARDDPSIYLRTPRRAERVRPTVKRCPCVCVRALRVYRFTHTRRRRHPARAAAGQRHARAPSRAETRTRERQGHAHGNYSIPVAVQLYNCTHETKPCACHSVAGVSCHCQRCHNSHMTMQKHASPHKQSPDAERLGLRAPAARSKATSQCQLPRARSA